MLMLKLVQQLHHSSILQNYLCSESSSSPSSVGSKLILNGDGNTGLLIPKGGGIDYFKPNYYTHPYLGTVEPAIDSHLGASYNWLF